MYKTIAHDPEVNAQRVFGVGATKQESIDQCRQALREYLVESPGKSQRYQRWIKHDDNGFLLRTIEVS